MYPLSNEMENFSDVSFYCQWEYILGLYDALSAIRCFVSQLFIFIVFSYVLINFISGIFWCLFLMGINICGNLLLFSSVFIFIAC